MYNLEELSHVIQLTHHLLNDVFLCKRLHAHVLNRCEGADGPNLEPVDARASVHVCFECARVSECVWLGPYCWRPPVYRM